MLSTNLYTILIPPRQPILSNPEWYYLHTPKCLFFWVKVGQKLSDNVQDCMSKRYLSLQYHEFQPFCVEVVKYVIWWVFFCWLSHSTYLHSRVIIEMENTKIFFRDFLTGESWNVGAPRVSIHKLVNLRCTHLAHEC